MKRKTIEKSISRSGIALHNGTITNIIFRPSLHKKGIIFYNVAIDPYKLFPIPISPFHVYSTNHATSVGETVRISTVEHILSAFSALGITDIIVEIEGDEPPVFDGSSYYFIEMVRDAGIIEKNEEITPLTISFPTWIIDRDKYIVAIPSDHFSVTYSIDFSQKSTALQYQAAYYKIDLKTYIEEISRARTFGFFDEIEWMKQNNLALGGSLENALVYSKNSILNDSLRYNNEAVRHKILDLIGDLYLINRPINAHIIAHKAGHSMDVAFAKKLLIQSQMALTNSMIENIQKEFQSISELLHIDNNK